MKLESSLDNILSSHQEEATKLTAKELISLIHACKKCGVDRLRVSDVEFSFFTPVDRLNDIPTKPALTTSGDRQIPSEEIEANALEEETLLKREAEIAELLVTDPGRYEELVCQGELIDEEKDNNGLEPSVL